MKFRVVYSNKNGRHEYTLALAEAASLKPVAHCTPTSRSKLKPIALYREQFVWPGTPFMKAAGSTYVLVRLHIGLIVEQGSCMFVSENWVHVLLILELLPYVRVRCPESGVPTTNSPVPPFPFSYPGRRRPSCFHRSGTCHNYSWPQFGPVSFLCSIIRHFLDWIKSQI
jgi:hypothetical protein